MNESANVSVNNMININNDSVMTEEERKEEELRQTIKMEPILATTELTEDEVVTKQKKNIKIKDIILIFVILALIVAIVYVVTNLL